MAKLPINDLVMNDTILSYEIESHDDFFQTISDGRYINRIFYTELREPEQK